MCVCPLDKGAKEKKKPNGPWVLGSRKTCYHCFEAGSRW